MFTLIFVCVYHKSISLFTIALIWRYWHILTRRNMLGVICLTSNEHHLNWEDLVKANKSDDTTEHPKAVNRKGTYIAMVKKIEDEKTNNSQHYNLHTKYYFTNVGKHCTRLTPPVFSGVRVVHLSSFLYWVFSACVLCTQCCQCL